MNLLYVISGLTFFASAAVAVDSSHMTASSSTSWSRFSPPSDFVSGHVLTVWFMVFHWPQSQEGDWVRPHLCKLARHGPWPLWFIRDKFSGHGQTVVVLWCVRQSAVQRGRYRSCRRPCVGWVSSWRAVNVTELHCRISCRDCINRSLVYSVNWPSPTPHSTSSMRCSSTAPRPARFTKYPAIFT